MDEGGGPVAQDRAGDAANGRQRKPEMTLLG
ncbi:hypothetical protein J2X64_001280 [Phycicoccus sp. 3266]|nr:hypothetical protein [Phycicoccus sp. 3266]